MKPLHQLQKEVFESQQAAQWAADVTKNESVIKGRIAANSRGVWFALYGGGNPEEMVKTLISSGMDARVSGSMVEAKLPKY